MSNPLYARPHIEALLIALVLLDPTLDVLIDETRLSPAASDLLDFAAANNVCARAHLAGGAEDDFGRRLAQRVGRLTMDDLCFFPAETVIGLANALPALGVSTVRRVA